MILFHLTTLQLAVSPTQGHAGVQVPGRAKGPWNGEKEVLYHGSLESTAGTHMYSSQLQREACAETQLMFPRLAILP